MCPGSTFQELRRASRHISTASPNVDAEKRRQAAMKTTLRTAARTPNPTSAKNHRTNMWMNASQSVGTNIEKNTTSVVHIAGSCIRRVKSTRMSSGHKTAIVLVLLKDRDAPLHVIIWCLTIANFNQRDQLSVNPVQCNQWRSFYGANGPVASHRNATGYLCNSRRRFLGGTGQGVGLSWFSGK